MTTIRQYFIQRLQTYKNQLYYKQIAYLRPWQNHLELQKVEFTFVKQMQFLILQSQVINQQRKKSQNQQTFYKFKSLITSHRKRLIDSFQRAEIATNVL
ncbi:unnamed protein product [Paramecium primaurelia]|uniref:Uncharacterized protein n=1 Tax=Paramecium primaurelia TaxID=5886 RepID=A0A8S1PVW2_PARPR|nr:unnamed protein product [Paramecium primaurelia]